MPDTLAQTEAPRGLNIAIIGAGLVGLSTAAFLRKQGHRITIFESSSFHAEIGAGIVLTPNGVVVLKKLLPELQWDNFQTVDLRSVEMYDADGTRTNTVDLSKGWEKYPLGWYMIHRVDLHKELMRLALDKEAMSEFAPAVVRLGTPVKTVDFDAERPSVTTSSGEVCSFDLILASDGIKSTVRRCMIGPEYEAPAGVMSFYRWIIDLEKNPELSWINTNRKSTGPTNIVGKNVWMFMYPLRGGKLINISAAHVDKRDRDTVDWTNEYAPMDTFLETFSDFDEKLMPLVAVAKEPRIWQLRRMPNLPTWTKGKVALLGDAAHAMNPTYGQGFAMGLEDAATIATLLPSGTEPDKISARLEAFETIRKPRAEHLSQLSADGVRIPIAELFGSAWMEPDLLGHDTVGIAKAALLRT